MVLHGQPSTARCTGWARGMPWMAWVAAQSGVRVGLCPLTTASPLRARRPPVRGQWPALKGTHARMPRLPSDSRGQMTHSYRHTSLPCHARAIQASPRVPCRGRTRNLHRNGARPSRVGKPCKTLRNSIGVRVRGYGTCMSRVPGAVSVCWEGGGVVACIW